MREVPIALELHFTEHLLLDLLFIKKFFGKLNPKIGGKSVRLGSQGYCPCSCPASPAQTSLTSLAPLRGSCGVGRAKDLWSC
ncbi:hypothetical protein AVEN_106158-1 [Araneus ventricosus]|uniref:Uncharacterized protein n=1 Tax=Araneus ventricosus TaxID=182803 RepID=A0A4Y2T6Q7_ARAVE|nr:hypothetical protein AVEN_106158-1 [Araneus ventricosus]